MTPEKLAELEKLEAAATPGRLHLDDAYPGNVLREDKQWVVSRYDPLALADAELQVTLRNNARDLFAALREAWRERDAALALSEQRKEFIADYEDEIKKAQEGEEYWRQEGNRLCKERDEARTALRLLWKEATDSECCFRTVNSGLDQHHISEPCRAAVKAVLGEG